MQQLGLDEYKPPSVAGSRTSKAAALSVEPRAGTLRARVLDCIREQGGNGATDDEVQVWLEMNPSTQRPRRIELRDHGFVVDSGRQRVTRGGEMAAVWVAVGR